MINLLDRLQSEFDLSYVFIAHDLSIVRHISDRVGVMYLGRIVEIGRDAEIYDHPTHPYTQALLSAVPVPDPEARAQRERIILTGDVPSPTAIPSGCRFRTRCWKAQRRCAQEVPALAVPEAFRGTAGPAAHASACHFAQEAAPVPPAPPGERRLRTATGRGDMGAPGPSTAPARPYGVQASLSVYRYRFREVACALTQFTSVRPGGGSAGGSPAAVAAGSPRPVSCGVMWVTPDRGSTSCGRPAASRADDRRREWATTTLSSASPWMTIIGRCGSAGSTRPASSITELRRYTSGRSAGSPR
ncbi:hypothetical protein GCM10017687_56820 [Streptomyces echinatus]